jgi:hypothetical protein
MDMISTETSIEIQAEARAEADPLPAAEGEPTSSPALTPVSWAGAKPAVGAVLAVRGTEPAQALEQRTTGTREGRDAREERSSDRRIAD